MSPEFPVISVRFFFVIPAAILRTIANSLEAWLDKAIIFSPTFPALRRKTFSGHQLSLPSSYYSVRENFHVQTKAVYLDLTIFVQKRSPEIISRLTLVS